MLSDGLDGHLWVVGGKELTMKSWKLLNNFQGLVENMTTPDVKTNLWITKYCVFIATCCQLHKIIIFINFFCNFGTYGPLGPFWSLLVLFGTFIAFWFLLVLFDIWLQLLEYTKAAMPFENARITTTITIFDTESNLYHLNPHYSQLYGEEEKK